jgi:glycosyltransferase involved in cell wall biosynthesis
VRLLAITPRVLHPANTGGRIRSLRLLEQVSRWHDLTVMCLQTPADAPSDVEAMRDCCTRLETIPWDEARPFSPRFYREVASHLLNPLPYTVLKYESTVMMQRIREHLDARQVDLLICDFLHMSINCLDVSFRPRLLFQHNVEATIRDGLVAKARNPLARAYLSLDAARLRRYEGRAAAAFDHCVTVSEDDCDTMRRAYGVTHVSAIPSAVDAAAFRPVPAPQAPPTCLFLGSMDMLANQDAVRLFTRDIWPIVRSQTALTFAVVGRNPPPAIRRLADQASGIAVTGTVDDVRPHLAGAQMLVVPLRIGGGTRIKIFEAMAMGIPVIATRLGAAGLPVTDGQDIVLADTPSEFAAAVVELSRNEALRHRLGAAGRRLVEAGHSWEDAGARFSRICEEVVSRHHSGAATR